MDELQFMNPKPIGVSVQKLDGNVVELECPKITTDMVKSTQDAAKHADKDAGGALCEQMAIFFGGKKDDYKVFDARVIKRVIEWMSEQFKNPT